jgi:hypothetical protein
LPAKHSMPPLLSFCLNLFFRYVFAFPHA